MWTRKTRPLHEYSADRLYADPAKAARRILEIANSIELDSRAYPHRENQRAVPFRDAAAPAEYGAGLKLAIERGRLIRKSGGHRRSSTAWPR